MGENGQSFTGVAKPCWDQTVGSELKASYIFFFLIAIQSDFNEDLKRVDKSFFFLGRYRLGHLSVL